MPYRWPCTAAPLWSLPRQALLLASWTPCTLPGTKRSMLPKCDLHSKGTAHQGIGTAARERHVHDFTVQKLARALSLSSTAYNTVSQLRARQAAACEGHHLHQRFDLGVCQAPVEGCTIPAVPPMPSTLCGTLGSTPPIGMRQYSSSSMCLHFEHWVSKELLCRECHILQCQGNTPHCHNLHAMQRPLAGYTGTSCFRKSSLGD